MRGVDAMSARADVSQHLDDIIQENRQNLSTPQAQHQYDTKTRRYRAQWSNEMGEHYDQQFQQWAVNTNTNGIAVTQNQIASHISDPVALAQDQETLRKYYVQRDNAQYGSHDPETANGAVLKADQDFYLTQIRAAGDNGARAKQALDDSGSILASRPDYDGLVRQVNGLVFKQQESPFVQNAINADLADAQRLVRSGAAPVVAGGAAGAAAHTTGPVYDQIGQVATAHGATPEETSFLKREAFLESSGKPAAQNGQSTGLFQFHPDTFAKLGGTDIADTSQQVAAALALRRQNVTALTNVGAVPTDANLYLMHQQGAAGGSALLTAPANVGAIAALTPTYETNGRTPEQAQAIATQAVLKNGGTADMTAVQFVDHWTQKWNGGAQGAQGGAQNAPAYPSTADALNATLSDRVDAFRASAQKQWGAEHPEEVDAATNTYERRLNQTVEQQKRQQEVNSHVVQSAMAGPNPPISEDQLRAVSPQVAAAYDELQFTNPYVRSGIENRFNTNAKGKALTYGNNFKDYFDRAMAPTGDPNRISDPTQLNNFVGPGEDAPLTNTGSDQLTQLMALRSTPQGEAFAAQSRNFVDQMHAELTFSNPSAGQFDPKGEALFSRAMAQVAPKLMSAYQNNTLDKVLDPKNPDFLGNIASSMARTPAQVMKDRLYPKDTSASLIMQTGTPSQQGLFLLKEAVAGGRLTAKQAAGIAVEHGFFAKPPGAVAPKPAGLQAPPVIMQNNAPAAGG